SWPSVPVGRSAPSLLARRWQPSSLQSARREFQSDAMPEISSQGDGVPFRNQVDVHWDVLSRRAQELASEIRVRLQSGDAAPDQIAELQQVVREMSETARFAVGANADEIRSRVQSLVDTLQLARQAGSAWMEQVAFPELEHLSRALAG